jgi:hypothetical protein
MERQEIERLLDTGRLQVSSASVKGGRWYDVRRIGITKTWKRDPESFSIPVKVGLKDCFRIENGSAQFRIARAAG